MAKSANKGFTLIELMLVIAVLGIIAAIALPSYLEQVRKSRRSDAKQALFDVAAKLELYYQDNKGYPSTAGGDDITILGYGSNPFSSLEGYYNISFISSAGTSYSIQAVPVGAQANDTGCAVDKSCCGTYQLNQLGVKSVTNNTLSVDRCW